MNYRLCIVSTPADTDVLAELKRCEAEAVAAEGFPVHRDGESILYLRREDARCVRARLNQVKALTNRVYVLELGNGLLFT